MSRLFNGLTRKVVAQKNFRAFGFPQSIGGNNAGDSATTESLLSFLYGPDFNFQYRLILKNDLSLPLYRERNFQYLSPGLSHLIPFISSRFIVMLVDRNGNLAENINRIPLMISLYTSESPPKVIETNTSGDDKKLFWYLIYWIF